MSESPDDLEEEIWSEYFRIKNTLIDNEQNFSDALGAAHMLLREKKVEKAKAQLLHCQREVGKILHLGIISKAFKTVPQEDKERIRGIARGNWTGIKDFEYCESKFETWFEESRFFDINIKKERQKAPHEY